MDNSLKDNLKLAAGAFSSIRKAAGHPALFSGAAAIAWPAAGASARLFASPRYGAYSLRYWPFVAR
jgi:hypothetical protein